MNDDGVTTFQPCGRAPIGIVTNCSVMDCEGQGCAMDAPQVVVSLDDLALVGEPIEGRCGTCGVAGGLLPCPFCESL